MESGLFLDLYDDVLTALLSLVKQNVKVYENLDAYVQERSEDVSPNVKLANVKNLFISLFGALALVLFAFILDRQIWSRKKNENRRKPLKLDQRKRSRSTCLRNYYPDMTFKLLPRFPSSNDI